MGHPHRAGTGRCGVRIEGVVTVTDDGGRRFNDTDRGMAIVG